MRLKKQTLVTGLAIGAGLLVGNVIYALIRGRSVGRGLEVGGLALVLVVAIYFGIAAFEARKTGGAEAPDDTSDSQ